MPLKMQKLATISTALAVSLSLSGCASYHMHLSELDPFHTSTPAAQNQQSQNQQAHAAPQMPKEPEKPVAKKPVAQLDTPPLYCRVGRGSAHFSGGWYDYRDATFTLYDGVAATVTLTAVHSAHKMTLQALFDKKGQKLLFCPMIDNAANGHIACASFYALQSDLQAGIKRTFDVPAAERDGELTCAYALDHLRTFKLPPE